MVFLSLSNKDRVNLIEKLGESLDSYYDGRVVNTDVFKPNKDEFASFIEEANSFLKEENKVKKGSNYTWFLLLLLFLLIGFISFWVFILNKL